MRAFLGNKWLQELAVIEPLVAPYRAILRNFVAAIPHVARYLFGKSFAILSLQVSCDMKSIAAGPLRLNQDVRSGKGFE